MANQMCLSAPSGNPDQRHKNERGERRVCVQQRLAAVERLGVERQAVDNIATAVAVNVEIRPAHQQTDAGCPQRHDPDQQDHRNSPRDEQDHQCRPPGADLSAGGLNETIWWLSGHVSFAHRRSRPLWHPQGLSSQSGTRMIGRAQPKYLFHEQVASNSKGKRRPAGYFGSTTSPWLPILPVIV